MKNKTGNYLRELAAGAARTMPAGSRSGTTVATALFLALCILLCRVPEAGAAEVANEQGGELKTIVVTGSLIPETRAEAASATPVIVITAEDLQDRGFASVADAIQHGSFATGSVDGQQHSGAFTQGAQTFSMYSLDPSYTKYLIDGLPIADYPALYGGSESFSSLDGIPTILVDHIDILPGGQSSLYGSDAIAGVVNIVLKKKMDAPEFDVRHGWTEKGGGEDLRLGAAVQNLFNSMPPVDRSYTGTETQPYDEFDYSVYGRTYYVQGTYKFGK